MRQSSWQKTLDQQEVNNLFRNIQDSASLKAQSHIWQDNPLKRLLIKENVIKL